MKITFLALLLCVTLGSVSQNIISNLYYIEKEDTIALVGATVKWLKHNDRLVSNNKGEINIKLSKEHHPDLLISKGVPEEVINASKEKMRSINSAWNTIQKLKSN